MRSSIQTENMNMQSDLMKISLFSFTYAIITGNDFVLLLSLSSFQGSKLSNELNAKDRDEHRKLEQIKLGSNEKNQSE